MRSVLVTKQKRNWHVLSTKNLDEISTLFSIFRLLGFSVTKSQGVWQHKNLEVKRFKIKYAIRLHKQQRIQNQHLIGTCPMKITLTSCTRGKTFKILGMHCNQNFGT